MREGTRKGTGADGTSSQCTVGRCLLAGGCAPFLVLCMRGYPAVHKLQLPGAEAGRHAGADSPLELVGAATVRHPSGRLMLALADSGGKVSLGHLPALQGTHASPKAHLANGRMGRGAGGRAEREGGRQAGPRLSPSLDSTGAVVWRLPLRCTPHCVSYLPWADCYALAVSARQPLHAMHTQAEHAAESAPAAAPPPLPPGPPPAFSPDCASERLPSDSAAVEGDAWELRLLCGDSWAALGTHRMEKDEWLLALKTLRVHSLPRTAAAFTSGQPGGHPGFGSGPRRTRNILAVGTGLSKPEDATASGRLLLFAIVPGFFSFSF
ncbi:hypothetical protein T492DRAFT_368939 [Pavlovales sp. CCMP2436]|nr:hypothetical protein T492DRAFT_368939 [Pavlovales sp. CCMP2436]